MSSLLKITVYVLSINFKWCTADAAAAPIDLLPLLGHLAVGEVSFLKTEAFKIR
jgi:hypothetical protein